MDMFRIEPNEFPDLVRAHLAENSDTPELEKIGTRMQAQNIDEWLSFISGVCKWGGRARLIEPPIREGNTREDITDRFSQASGLLHSGEPSIDRALKALCQLNGIQVSVASKHLRFLCPRRCPVLDSHLEEATGYARNRCGYLRFSDHCQSIGKDLQKIEIENPMNRDDGAWYAADVEMALFARTQGWG